MLSLTQVFDLLLLFSDGLLKLLCLLLMIPVRVLKCGLELLVTTKQLIDFILMVLQLDL